MRFLPVFSFCYHPGCWLHSPISPFLFEEQTAWMATHPWEDDTHAAVGLPAHAHRVRTECARISAVLRPNAALCPLQQRSSEPWHSDPVCGVSLWVADPPMFPGMHVWIPLFSKLSRRTYSVRALYYVVKVSSLISS